MLRNFIGLLIARVWFLLFPFNLCGISKAELPQGIPTPQNSVDAAEVSVARNYVALLQTRDYEKLRQITDSTLSHEEFIENVNRQSMEIPAEQPKSVRLIAYKSNMVLDTRTSHLISDVHIKLQYEFGKKVVLIVAHTNAYGDEISVKDIQINDAALSDLDAYRVDLTTVTGSQFVALAFAISLLLFNAWAIFVAISHRSMHRPWLWLPFLIAGVGGVQFEWTANVLSNWEIFAIHLPIVSVRQPFYDTLYIQYSAPVGSILFLFSYLKYLKISRINRKVIGSSL
jgi:hypothetical protein